MYALRLDDAPPPATLARRLGGSGRFWLDSEAGHPEGRWGFLGGAPVETRAVPFGAADPLGALRALGPPPGDEMEGDPLDLDADGVPWWVGYVAYDAAWSDPRRLGLRTPPRLPRPRRPVLWLGRHERLVAVDRARDETFVLGADRDGCRALAETLRAPPAGDETPPTIGPVIAEAPAVHRARIEHALEAIAAGEIYQVNLARRWSAGFDGSPMALWRAMRRASPVPLGAYLEHGSHAVLARTMERFLRWDRPSRRLWTSPIKGTIARSGRDDLGEAARLSTDDKERAEHSMIVDLMRNDLSRVAEVGTVRVADPLRVEPFAGLSHLVSTVACRTRPGVDAADVLEATFPPGSITGTPKLRAMELIEREEAHARGVYTGAVGFVDRAGGLSLAVAIRTAVVSDGELAYFAGGGLVSASDPEREIAETDLKARVLFDALSRELHENHD
ncbi:MAG TPA: anthranilate synthase component I family protein [Sandaracinaceae bacterium LLY-WYZ-13_1]|nr:anthranilate synthase component I family protein [Sandaracinaceae bacterium LLY-WYZ-13_1]